MGQSEAPEDIEEASRTAGPGADYLRALGVPDLPPLTCPFDPGYDALTVESHIAQSAHLMAGLKLSMACWQLADWSQTVKKAGAAHRYGVPVLTGGGPFEIAVASGRLEEYLDLCAGLGVDLVEAGSGFTEMPLAPRKVVAAAALRGLRVQFELGGKHTGPFSAEDVTDLLAVAYDWLEAGADQVVVEGRESARGVGLFDDDGSLDFRLADRFAESLGLDAVVFEAPDKRSQFALLDHFGPPVRLSNVRLEELLRVEIYRRGLHSDSFGRSGLAGASLPVPAPRAGTTGQP